MLLSYGTVLPGFESPTALQVEDVECRSQIRPALCPQSQLMSSCHTCEGFGHVSSQPDGFALGSWTFGKYYFF